MIKSCLLSSAALAGVLMAGSASAQSSSSTDEPAAQSAPQRTGINEIVVTAQRRSESVQDASVSIDVISGEQLSGLNSASDITTVAPTVQVSTSGPNPQVYIRGVGDPAVNGRSQSAVAFNIDDVYFGRTTQAGPMFFDVSRMEVLKGPQGTLYGRNASGGAINVITNDAIIGESGGYAGFGIGNFGLIEGNAAVNAPIGDNAAVRVAGQVIDRDGYTSNGGQDQKVQAGRIKLTWEPTDTVRLRLSADVSHIGGQGSGSVVKGWFGETPPGQDPWRDNTEAPTAYPFLFGPNTAPFTAPDDRFLDQTAWGVKGQLDWDLGFADLTFIPAYRWQDSQATAYGSRFRFYEDNRSDQLSLELRLGRSSRALDWVVGLYHFEEDQKLAVSAFSSGALNGLNAFPTTDAWAAFGQATVSITEKLRAIGGLRYTREVFDADYQRGVSGLPLVEFTPTDPFVDTDTLTFNNVDFKVGAEFDLGPENMLFATYATGFKGGGLSTTPTCGGDPYDPEKVRAWTVGSRNRFADNRVQLNLEGFYWKYKDQQISFVGADTCGGIGLLTRNPGDATVKGVTADLTVQPFPSDTLRVSVEYNDATYDQFRLVQLGTGNYNPAFGSLCSTQNVGGPFFEVNCDGNPLTRTPKWSGAVNYQHVFELGDGSRIELGGDMTFASGRWIEFSYTPNARDDAYQLYSARLTYRAPSDRFSITAFVNNITDTPVYTGGSTIPTLAPNGAPYIAANILPPRMYGARARVNF